MKSPIPDIDKLRKFIAQSQTSLIDHLYHEEKERISKIINKNCPKIKIGIWTVKYRQVLYRNRYFYLSVKNGTGEIRINPNGNMIPSQLCFLFAYEDNKWLKFIADCEKFDQKLNKNKEIPTWIDA